MYDPSVGRWLEEDPIGFEAGDADLYRYVGNNPVNETDPSGLEADKKAPEWMRYMKGIELKSDYETFWEFRDSLGNYVMIRRDRAGTIRATLEPGTKNPEGRNLEAPVLGKCEYSFGTNDWIFWTNDKGQMTKIVWVNLVPTIPGNPRMGVRKGVAGKAKEDLQNQINGIIRANRNNPDNALRLILAIANNPKIVDPGGRSVRIVWKGPFTPVKTDK